MTKEQIYDQIERYINGELVGEELDSFLKKQEIDPEFANEVKLHRNLQSAIADTKKEALKESLSELRSNLSNKGNIRRIHKYRLLASAAAFIALLLAVWFLFLRNPVSTELMDDSRMVIEDETPAAIPAEDSLIQIQKDPSSIAEQQLPQNENESNPEVIKENSDIKDILPQEEDYSDRFIANTDLENIIQNNPNTELYKFTVESLKSNQVVERKNGSSELRIAGMLQTAETILDKKLIVQFFDNTGSSISGTDAVFSGQLNLEAAEEGIFGLAGEPIYYFDNSMRFTAFPGIHYYVIRFENDGTILSADKFKIEK
jgi:hypothetical protein